MSTADYGKLPPQIDHDIRVKMPPEAWEQYRVFRKERIMEIMGTEITSFNAAALSSKLLQFANGAVYDNELEKNWHTVHDAKLDGLEDLIEQAVGNPVLVFYWYKHDLARLKARFPGAVVYSGPQHVKAWNARQIPLMLMHPASAGHGLNLQFGGNISVWFSMLWSSEYYRQACARLPRPGQTKTVMNYRIITAGTLDEHALNVLAGKIGAERALMDAVKAVIDEEQIKM
jgi:SNF2 family DNA or RNA helicase